MKSLRRRAIAKSFGFKYRNRRGNSEIKVSNIMTNFGEKLTDKQFVSTIFLKGKIFNATKKSKKP